MKIQEKERDGNQAQICSQNRLDCGRYCCRHCGGVGVRATNNNPELYEATTGRSN